MCGDTIIDEVIMDNDKLFDPLWRDDIYNEEVLNIPLVLPPVSEPNNSVWVDKKLRGEENVFGKECKFEEPRLVTAMIKKIRSHPARSFKDGGGNLVKEDDPAWNYLNPPKAWMSDNLEELMTMYSVAQEVRGEVLIGGLGMGIFPQMALFLDRPVDSYTIVDNCPDVIDITTRAWLDHLDGDTRAKFDIVTQSIADYINTTCKKFDTIFIDIWEDVDSRYLPYMNLLVDRLKPLCKEGGRIYLWGYGLAVDAFVKLVNYYERSGIDIQKLPVPIDPLTSKFGLWRARKENAHLPNDVYEKKARELALAEKLTELEFDCESFFCPYPLTFHDMQIINKILSLAKREGDGNDGQDNTGIM